MGQLSAAFNSCQDSCPEEHTVNNIALLSPRSKGEWILKKNSWLCALLHWVYEVRKVKLCLRRAKKICKSIDLCVFLNWGIINIWQGVGECWWQLSRPLCWLIFSEIFLFRWLTHEGFSQPKKQTIPPVLCYFYIYPPLCFWCLESSFSRRVSGFHNLPSLLHDICSRCVTWEAGLILLLTSFYQPLWNDHQMQQSGPFPHTTKYFRPWQLTMSSQAQPGGKISSLSADPAGLKNSSPKASGTGCYV